jgi:hypothetical protein
LFVGRLATLILHAVVRKPFYLTTKSVHVHFTKSGHVLHGLDRTHRQALHRDSKVLATSLPTFKYSHQYFSLNSLFVTDQVSHPHKSSKTGHCALYGVVCRLYQGVLYFKNIIGSYGTRVNITPFAHIIKTQPSLHRFSRNLQMLNKVFCKSLSPKSNNKCGKYLYTRRFTYALKCGFNYTDFRKTQNLLDVITWTCPVPNFT